MDDREWIEFERRMIAHFDAKMKKLLVWVIAMIMGGLTSIVSGAIAWGKLNAKVEAQYEHTHRHHMDMNLHMPADQKYATFMTKQEWSDLMVQRDAALRDLKDAIIRFEDKLDKRLP